MCVLVLVFVCSYVNYSSSVVFVNPRAPCLEVVSRVSGMREGERDARGLEVKKGGDKRLKQDNFARVQKVFGSGIGGIVQILSAVRLPLRVIPQSNELSSVQF